MKIEARATAYDIVQLGYFKSGQAVQGFPSVKVIVESLIKWGGHVSQIENTKTYASSNLGASSNTYFVDGYHDSTSSQAVVVLWKEVRTYKGDVYGITRNKQPGKGTVTKKNLDTKVYIPGFPIYFYFDLNDKRLITFVFDHSDMGKSNLQFYLEGFLRNRAKPWVVARKSKVSQNVIENQSLGFSVDGSEVKIDKGIEVKSLFKISKTGDNLKMLLDNQSDITRLQRVEKIKFDAKTGVNKTGAEVLYEIFFRGLKSSVNSPTSIRYKSEVPWKPSDAEIKEVYENALETLGNGNLLGLTAITRHSKRISFFGNPDKETLQLDIPGGFSGFIPAYELFSSIQKVIDELP